MKKLSTILLILSAPCFADNSDMHSNAAPAATMVPPNISNSPVTYATSNAYDVQQKYEALLTAEHAKNASLTRTIQALEDAVKALKEQVTHLEGVSKNNGTNSTSNNASAEETNRLQAQINTLTTRIDTLTAMLQASKNKIADLTNENNLLNDRLNTAQDNFNNRNIIAKNKMIAALKVALALRDETISSLRAEKEALIGENQALKYQSNMETNILHGLNTLFRL